MSDSLVFVDINLDIIKDQYKINGSINDKSTNRKMALFNSKITELLAYFSRLPCAFEASARDAQETDTIVIGN